MFGRRDPIRRDRVQPVPDVDFVVNCYERTYRDVLAPGFVSEKVFQQRYDFAEVTVLINNVDDREDASRLARQLVELGEITRFEFVGDHIDDALRRCGLKWRHIKRLPYFTTCCLVAVCLDGPPWLVYWDADVTLREPMDWITPTLGRMLTDDRLAIGNPNTWYEGLTVWESLEVDGDLAIGYGFSDLTWMARRAELTAPIYRYVSPASWRYPLAATEPIFEQRVDAWMRRRGRLRLTYLPAVMTHPDEGGANYPPRTLRQRVRGRLQRDLGPRLAAVSGHPAMRPWARWRTPWTGANR